MASLSGTLNGSRRLVRGSLGTATRHLPVLQNQRTNNNELVIHEVDNTYAAIPNRAIPSPVSPAVFEGVVNRKTPIVHRTSPVFAQNKVLFVPSSHPKHVANVATLQQHASRFRVPATRKTNKRMIKPPIPFSKARKQTRRRR
jgi:hypothetical protein